MKYKTYITEDGHTNADCPICEGSEHIDELEEFNKCQLCQMEGRPNYIRVFQMGFDIAERENIPNSEVEGLWLEIEDLINNYKYKNTKGENSYFKSVGCLDTEDMTHAYGKKYLKILNKTEG
jgi:hypothetical protein